MNERDIGIVRRSSPAHYLNPILALNRYHHFMELLPQSASAWTALAIRLEVVGLTNLAYNCQRMRLKIRHTN